MVCQIVSSGWDGSGPDSAVIRVVEDGVPVPMSFPVSFIGWLRTQIVLEFKIPVSCRNCRDLQKGFLW